MEKKQAEALNEMHRYAGFRPAVIIGLLITLILLITTNLIYTQFGIITVHQRLVI